MLLPTMCHPPTVLHSKVPLFTQNQNYKSSWKCCGLHRCSHRFLSQLMLRVPEKQTKMFTTVFYVFWAIYIWLDLLPVPVTGQLNGTNGVEDDSNPLQPYLIVAIALLVIVLLVCFAAVIGVALIYFKLSQIQKMLSEKDDETYAQIGTHLTPLAQKLRKDQDSVSTSGNVKGNNGIVETGSEHGMERMITKCPYHNLPDGMVRALSLEFPNEATLDMDSARHANGVRGNSQLTLNISKCSSPLSHNNASRNCSQRELSNSQRNILPQTKESPTCIHAPNKNSIVTQTDQKATKQPTSRPAASIPEPPSPDSSSYAIYDVPRPCLCSSICHDVSWPTPASDFQHNPLKRSLSEIGPAAFEIPLEMVQENKYAVPRPVTYPSHKNYETEFKDLEKSSSKDSGVLSYVDSQLLDLIPEGNKSHIDSKNNLETKQRRVADKESIEDKIVFI
ncbi:uncharacterized protein LOC116971871 [Amblyraja radiata]|uniref:uncharacterized protein LOC116971871 n=1 Tax=Amblyraja radiata TaxID=386614 RepID=UPI001402F159|nr:uncharacterized protein LOC116971871 [Amblyraja radiata]